MPVFAVRHTRAYDFLVQADSAEEAEYATTNFCDQHEIFLNELSDSGSTSKETLGSAAYAAAEKHLRLLPPPEPEEED